MAPVPNTRMKTMHPVTTKTDVPESEINPGELQVDVEIEAVGWTSAHDDPTGFCVQVLNRTLEHLDLPKRVYEVSVLLTEDAHQKKLNAEYRGKDSSTNVLSFPSGEAVDAVFPAELAMPLGDITMALETVEHESAAGGLSFADHFCHLLVHGMLHLAGYDHETDNDAEQMEALEIEILAGLGVENPYPGGVTATHE